MYTADFWRAQLDSVRRLLAMFGEEERDYPLYKKLKKEEEAYENGLLLVLESAQTSAI